MDLITKILEMSRDEKMLLAIRVYGDEDNFWCGYIKDYNEICVLIYVFDLYGRFDGFVYELKENIESIEYDNDYLKGQKYLIDSYEDVKSSDKRITNKNDWQHYILKNFVGKNEVIEFGFKNDSIILGRLLSLDKSFFEILAIDDLGYDEGKSLYLLDDLSYLHLNSLESAKRHTLNSFRTRPAGAQFR